MCSFPSFLPSSAPLWAMADAEASPARAVMARQRATNCWLPWLSHGVSTAACTSATSITSDASIHQAMWAVSWSSGEWSRWVIINIIQDSLLLAPDMGFRISQERFWSTIVKNILKSTAASRDHYFFKVLDMTRGSPHLGLTGILPIPFYFSTQTITQTVKKTLWNWCWSLSWIV